MRDWFLQHLEHWLPAVLREKILQSTDEDRLCFIGAADFGTMLADYVLMEVAIDPLACWSACGLDGVSNSHLGELTQFSPETLAAGFLAASAELAAWGGTRAVAFLVRHGVPRDSAREVAHAVEIVSDKLGARGRALLVALDEARKQKASPRWEPAHTSPRHEEPLAPWGVA